MSIELKMRGDRDFGLSTLLIANRWELFVQPAAWQMTIKERNDLVPVGTGGHALKCTGADPYVLVELPDARPEGPYFEICIVGSIDFPGLVRVYVDSGAGFSESAASDATVHRIGSDCVFYVQLQANARRLRLDPYAALDQAFEISTLELRTFRHRRNIVSRAAYATRLLRSRGKTTKEIYSAARHVYRNEGLSGILRRLHPTALYPRNQNSPVSAQPLAPSVFVPELTQEWSIPQFCDLVTGDDPFRVYNIKPSIEEKTQEIAVLVRTQFKRPNLLRRAIESAIRQDQSLASFRVTVFVLASAEFRASSKIICGDLERQYRKAAASLKIVFCDTAHRSSLLNEGLRRAKSVDFVCILDDDDYLFPSHFGRHLTKHASGTFAATYSAADILYAEGPDDSSGEGNSGIVMYAAWWSYAKLLRLNLFPIQAVVFRPQPNIFFSTDLDALEDWDFWLRLFQARPIAGVVERTSAFRMPRPGTPFAEDRIKHHMHYLTAFRRTQAITVDAHLSPDEMSSLVPMISA